MSSIYAKSIRRRYARLIRNVVRDALARGTDPNELTYGVQTIVSEWDPKQRKLAGGSGNDAQRVMKGSAIFLDDLAIALDSIGKTGDAKDCRAWAAKLYEIGGQQIERRRRWAEVVKDMWG